MKFDLLAQSLLILTVMLLLGLLEGIRWSGAFLIILAIWQFLSALHLFFVYKHILRLSYLRTALILAATLPLWVHFIGNLAYLPVVGLVIWYFIQTILDTRTVYRRPQSFWDLL